MKKGKLIGLKKEHYEINKKGKELLSEYASNNKKTAKIIDKIDSESKTKGLTQTKQQVCPSCGSERIELPSIPCGYKNFELVCNDCNNMWDGDTEGKLRS